MLGLPGGAPNISPSTSSNAQSSANGNRVATGDVPYDLTTGTGSRGFQNNVAFPGSKVIGENSAGNALSNANLLWIVGGGLAIGVIIWLRNR